MSVTTKGPGDLEEGKMASLQGGRDVTQHRWEREKGIWLEGPTWKLEQKSEEGEHSQGKRTSSASGRQLANSISWAALYNCPPMEQGHLQCAAPSYLCTYTEGPGASQDRVLHFTRVFNFFLHSSLPHHCFR